MMKFGAFFVLVFLTTVSHMISTKNKEYINEFVVEVAGDTELAHYVAETHGFDVKSHVCISFYCILSFIYIFIYI